MNRKILNQIYGKLSAKCASLLDAFIGSGFEAEWGWYSGHYDRNDRGEYELLEYPLPVISVKGLCDIEIGLDMVTVSAKRKREEVLNADLSNLAGRPFECYGVENYLDDYYLPGVTMEEFQERIRKSQEKELGFSFLFSFDVAEDEVCRTAALLRQSGFYN